MLFRQIFDERLAQYAYLIGCQQTGEALVVDPERDIDRYVSIAEAEGLRITAVTETHIHADFLSGSREFAARYGVKVYLPGHSPEGWKYGWADDFDVTLLKHGDSFRVGMIEIRAVHSPGHTPEHTSFLVTDHGGGVHEPMGLVTGDFVFVGDLGRPDLLETAAGVKGVMKSSAIDLYRSALGFLDLPDYMQVWPGHGAGSACGKALGAVPESTVGYERRFSPALSAVRDGEKEFVEFILAGQPEPPPYFARMKTLNRDGPPILGPLPDPERMSVADIVARTKGADAIVLDARRERADYMRAHLPGSIFAPLNKTFPTIAGSYADPEQAIYLIVPADSVSSAVLDLIRIGYDHVAGFATPQDLAEYAGNGGVLSSIETIDLAELDRRRGTEDITILDVRGAAEFTDLRRNDAMNIAHTRLALRLAELPRGHAIAVHCATGSRASSASSLLEREGFDVLYVDDIFSTWARANPDAVEYGATPSTAGAAD
jgi:hydroxyacylglutathione hydrolase